MWLWKVVLNKDFDVHLYRKLSALQKYDPIIWLICACAKEKRAVLNRPRREGIPIYLGLFVIHWNRKQVNKKWQLKRIGLILVTASDRNRLWSCIAQWEFLKWHL